MFCAQSTCLNDASGLRKGVCQITSRMAVHTRVCLRVRPVLPVSLSMEWMLRDVALAYATRSQCRERRRRRIPSKVSSGSVTTHLLSHLCNLCASRLRARFWVSLAARASVWSGAVWTGMCELCTADQIADRMHRFTSLGEHHCSNSSTPTQGKVAYDCLVLRDDQVAPRAMASHFARVYMCVLLDAATRSYVCSHARWTEQQTNISKYAFESDASSQQHMTFT